MSWMYPRTVTVTRPAQTTGVGLQAYQAAPQSPTTIGSYPASIQLKKEVGIPPAKLPGDAARTTYWTIFVQTTLGTIRDRDILIDDQSARYQVTAAYWNSLGYACLCERLEA